MIRKIAAVGLILAQVMSPVYAFSAQDHYYYRYGKGGANLLLGDSGAGDDTSNQSAPIPSQVLNGLIANASGPSVASASPASALAAVSSYLVGGVSAVVFDDASPSIPGMTFNKLNGLFEGTPAAAFTQLVTIRYHDASNKSGLLQLPVTIYPKPALTSSKTSYNLPVSTEASDFSIQATPSNDGFYAGVTYSLAPTSDPLPAGLSMANGIVSGRSTAPIGTVAKLVIRGTSLANSAVFADRAITLNIVDQSAISLDVKPDSPLVWHYDLQNKTMVDAQGFSPTPTIQGPFTAPVTWSITDGPSWLHIDSSAQLFGAPDGLGTYNFTINATDAKNKTASDTASVKVTLPGHILLSPGGQAFTVRTGETFATPAQTPSNVVGAYTFGQEDIPAEVKLDTTTGVFTGNFPIKGNYTWKLHVADADGRVDGTNAYLEYATVLPAVTMGGGSVASAGVIGLTPISISWPKPANIIGKANYVVIGDLPGTLYYKVYDNDNPLSPATYVTNSGTSVRQGDNETAAQAEARLASDHLVFDTLALTLNGTPSSSGTFTARLYVSDDHQDNGYKVNPSDASKGTANSATSPASSFTVLKGNLASVNGGGDGSMSQFTSRATLFTALRDAKSNAAWSNHNAQWSLASGTLPPGITTTISGGTDVLMYGGYANQQGTWSNITWKVTDNLGNEITTKPVTFTVGPRQNLNLAATPGKTRYLSQNEGDAAGTSVAVSNAPNGKIDSSQWTVTGSLPTGITYIVGDGVVNFSGVPTVKGTFPITVAVTDSIGGTASLTLKFVVGSYLDVHNVGSSSQTLVQYGTKPSLYSYTTPAGSLSPWAGGGDWQLYSGTLPPGITTSLDITAEYLTYNGYPTTVGTWSNIIWSITTADGSVSYSDPVSFTVTPRLPLQVVSSAGDSVQLTSGVDTANVTISPVNNANNAAITAANWTISGSVPIGVTYKAGSAGLVFSGVPTQIGTFPITVTGVDAGGGRASTSLTFYVVTSLSLLDFYGANQTLNQYTSQPTLNVSVRTVGNEQYTGVSTWELLSGTLPPGISAITENNGGNLIFTGYATSQGTWSNIVYRVTTADGSQLTNVPISFTVGDRGALTLTSNQGTVRSTYANTDDVALTVTPSNVPNGQVLAATDYTVTGTLPPGVTYKVTAGILAFSGKVTAIGSWNINVAAKDSFAGAANLALTFNTSSGLYLSNSSGSQSLSATVTPTNLVTKILSRSTGSAYTGGATWTLTSGSLPDGITTSLSADGSTLTYSGYAGTVGTFANVSWKVVARDGSILQTDPVTFTILTKQALQLVSSQGTTRQLRVDSDDANTVITASNPAYGVQPSASTWSVTNLAPGLSWTPTGTGVSITGVGTQIGTWNAVITGKDSTGSSASITVAFNVINNTSMINLGALAQSLSQLTSQPSLSYSVRSVGNYQYTSGVTWSLISGSLPPGITANTAASNGGVLSFVGYPTTQGTWSNIVYQAKTADGGLLNTAAASFTVGPRGVLTLTNNTGNPTRLMNPGSDDAGVTIIPTNLANGVAITAANWVVTGTLPPGVTKTANSTGLVFAGKSSTNGTYNLTISATDAAGGQATTNVSFVVGLYNPQFTLYWTAGSAATAKITSLSGVAVTATTNFALKYDTNYGADFMSSWVPYSGAVPPGINSNYDNQCNCILFGGSPTTAGSWTIVYAVTDRYGLTQLTPAFTFTANARAALTLTASPVSASQTLTTGKNAATMTGTAKNVPYGTTTSDLTWTVTGYYPVGITWSVVSGVFKWAGTPLETGDFYPYVQAVDKFGGDGGIAGVSYHFGVTVPSNSYCCGFNDQGANQVSGKNNGANVVCNPSYCDNASRIETLKVGTTLSAMGYTFRNSNNSAYAMSTVSVYSGTMPPGMTPVYSSDKTYQYYSGVPTKVGTYGPIRLQVADSAGTKTLLPPVTFVVTN